MDIISYILAKKAAGSGAEALERVAVVEDRVDDLETTVEGLKNGIKYKGAVDYYKDLPSNYTTKQVGYCFTVKYKGESGTQPSGKEYVWGQDGDNLAWIELGGLLDEYVKSITYDLATNSLVIVDQDNNEISFSAATHGEVEAVADRVQAIEGDYLTSTDKTALEGQIDALDDRLEVVEGKTDLGDFTNNAGYVKQAAIDTALENYTTTADLTTLLAGKQATIADLDDIRAGAAAGATALQVVPSEYITETELGTALDDYTTTAELTTLLAGKEDADATIVKDAEYAHITVTDSSVSDGTNTFSQYVLPQDVVQDANYAHISVSSENGVSDGTNTYKYVLPNDVARLSDIPTELPNPNALTINEAGTAKTYDGSGAVSISIPAVDDFAEKDEAVGSFELTIDSSTYVLSLQAKDINGDNLGSAETIDLPLESMVVSGSYDAENKQLVLELKSGDTIEIPIDDIIAGLQEEITVDNKLDADLVDDTNADNKFVSAQEKQDIADNTAARHTHSNKALLDTYTQTEVDLADAVDKKHNHSNKAVLDDITAAQIEQIGTNTQSITDILNGDSISSFGDVETALNGKEDTINDLADIRAGAALGATAIQPGDLATVATSGSYNDLENKPELFDGDYESLTNKPDLTVYAEKEDLATVATSGSYNDLSNKPEIPAAQVNADWNASGTVAEILNKPSIPTDTAQLTNSAGYITATEVSQDYPSKEEVEAELDDKQDVITEESKLSIDLVDAEYVNEDDVDDLFPEDVAAFSDITTLNNDPTVKKVNVILTDDINAGDSDLTFRKDAHIDLDGHKIDFDDWGLEVRNGATLVVENGTINSFEAPFYAREAATLTINNGNYTATNNYIVGTNGSNGSGNNTITINGGTFNAEMSAEGRSKGYIACGVYVANNDTVEINAGTFIIKDGVGICARSGNTIVHEGATFTMQQVQPEITEGYVGDSKILVPANVKFVLDLAANYPGGKPTLRIGNVLLDENSTDEEAAAVEAVILRA